MSDHVSVNVRYLLHRNDVPRSEWTSWLARRASLDPQTAKSLVRGLLADEQVSDNDLRKIGGAFELAYETENLRFQGFAYAGHNVLRENLRFLLGSLGHGGKKSLAGELNVDPTTISRWLNGSFEPQPSTLRHIVSYFGLPPITDLHEDPIFLSTEPVSMTDRRSWLRRRIDALPTEEIRELYPALRRLLEER